MFVALYGIISTLWISFLTMAEIPFLSFSRARIHRRLAYWSRGLLWAADIKLKVEYSCPIEIQPHRAYMVMSNHESYYDIPLTLAALEMWDIRMLAKQELFQTPLWGAAMRRAEFIDIDRKDAAQAVTALEAAKAKMQDGIMIWVAPEGTRTRDGVMGPFKPGGFKMAVDLEATIIPVAILGARAVMPPGQGRISRGHEVVVRVGQPLEAASFGPKGRKELMKAVRNAIEGLLTGPELPYSFQAPLAKNAPQPGLTVKDSPHA